jgi:hypothetical protein
MATAPKLVPTWGMKMNRLMTLALAATFAAPAAVAGQPATSIAVNCNAGTASAGGEGLNLKSQSERQTSRPQGRTDNTARSAFGAPNELSGS